MAAKITKKKALNITAIIDINADSNQILLEVEDVETPMNLADLVSEFNGEEVKITIAQSEDIA